MKAILLAAGVGTRLSPLTHHLPKCLMPVNGRPLLEYWLMALQRAGIAEVLINLHHHADIVKDWLKHNAFSLHIETAYEPSLLGTGGTLLANRNFAGDEPLMLIHADNLCGVDLNRFIASHHRRPAGTDITMMTFDTPRPETCGIVELDRRGIVQAFHEKSASPPGRLANAAVYIVEPSIIDFVAGLGKAVVDFSTEVIPAFLGKISTFHNRVYHRDIGSTESFLAAQLEYPFFPGGPLGRDPWKALSENNDMEMPLRFLSALADAVGADIIRINDISSARLSSAVHGARRDCILTADLTDKDLPALVTALSSPPLPQDRIWLFFARAPKGFSSKSLFDGHGWKSVAFCAVDAPVSPSAGQPSPTSGR